jgi:hypothetical protein
MTYKIDAPLIVDGKANPNRHIQIGNWRGPIALDGDIDAQIDALPLTKKKTAKVEIREGWTTLQERVETRCRHRLHSKSGNAKCCGSTK